MVRGAGSVMILGILAIFSLSSQCSAKCMSAFCSSGIGHRAGVNDLKISPLAHGSLNQASSCKKRVKFLSLRVIDSASKCGDSVLAHSGHSNMLSFDLASVCINKQACLWQVFIKRQVSSFHQGISSVMIGWRCMVDGQTASAPNWNKPIKAPVGRSLVMEIQTYG